MFNQGNRTNNKLTTKEDMQSLVVAVLILFVLFLKVYTVLNNAATQKDSDHNLKTELKTNPPGKKG